MIILFIVIIYQSNEIITIRNKKSRKYVRVPAHHDWEVQIKIIVILEQLKTGAQSEIFIVT